MEKFAASALHANHFCGRARLRAHFSPDSPDEMAFGHLRAPILAIRSSSYDGSSSGIMTDPTGERRNPQFRQRFRGLWSCRPNPSGESEVILRISEARDLGEFDRFQFYDHMKSYTASPPDTLR